MNHKEEAEKLIELFYQEAPELFGTGKARVYGEKCAIISLNYAIAQFRLMVPSPYKAHMKDLIKIKKEIENM